MRDATTPSSAAWMRVLIDRPATPGLRMATSSVSSDSSWARRWRSKAAAYATGSMPNTCRTTAMAIRMPAMPKGYATA